MQHPPRLLEGLGQVALVIARSRQQHSHHQPLPRPTGDHRHPVARVHPIAGKLHQPRAGVAEHHGGRCPLLAQQDGLLVALHLVLMVLLR
ncbi:hypothetical protein D7Y11_42790 [Corallococcus sp. AB018]|nr:hypothetical protein D7Y11_42790 [Corallococcus sp. AB018]